jgi:hypothetical protein
MITCDLCTFQLRDDPSFKPSGGRLGENDMDYDTDDKTMILLFDSCVSLSNIQYNQFSLEFIWKLEV